MNKFITYILSLLFLTSIILVGCQGLGPLGGQIANESGDLEESNQPYAEPPASGAIPGNTGSDHDHMVEEEIVGGSTDVSNPVMKCQIADLYPGNLALRIFDRMPPSEYISPTLSDPLATENSQTKSIKSDTQKTIQSQNDAAETPDRFARLSWDPANCPEPYYVVYMKSGNGEWIQLKTKVNDTDVSISPVPQTRPLYFKVAAAYHGRILAFSEVLTLD